MVQSVAVAPHVTTVFEADLSAIVAHREAHRAALEADGVKLTYTAYFIRASVAALQAVPEVNSRWHDDALELFGDCNVGVATALPQGGLILPVIHRAQTLDLRATAERLQDLTQRARSGTLAPSDVQHGTFSISNHGVSGSLVAARRHSAAAVGHPGRRQAGAAAGGAGAEAGKGGRGAAMAT
jgi:2-oxoglutarate dehydrogenase E2 component (dihydrolipoamide succinyltransferase)